MESRSGSHCTEVPPGVAKKKLEKVMIMTAGSRGDVQPFIAAALEVRKAGFTVCLVACSDFADLAKEFGLKFYAAFCPANAEMKNNEKLFKAICDGSTLGFIKGITDAQAKYAGQHVQEFFRAVEEYRPDLIIQGSLVEYFGQVATFRLRIPTIQLLPSATLAVVSKNRMAGGLPNMPWGLNAVLHKHLIIGGLYNGHAILDKHMEKAKGYKIGDIITKADFISWVVEPKIPYLLAIPEFLVEAVQPGASRSENTRCIGNLVVDADTELEHARSSDQASGFGDVAEMRQLQDFLDQEGSPPVYMGWGSMLCRSPKHTLKFALEALRYTGLRGVILGGWANLNLELLDRVTDGVLLEFAEKNVIILKTAPHEWLFPRCACTVHHGGAGTTVAALRAGVPTIITPVFGDQYDNAYAISKFGVGIGLNQFQRLKVEELGKAIQLVTTDTKYAQQARLMAKDMCASNGGQQLITELQDFWTHYVETGKFQQIAEEHVLHRQRAHHNFVSVTWCCK